MNIAHRMDSQDVSSLNYEPRRHESDLSARDRTSIARLLSVDVREVQRWFTTAGQKRNILPAGARGRSWETLPSDALRDRWTLATGLTSDGVERDPVGDDPFPTLRYTSLDLLNAPLGVAAAVAIELITGTGSAVTPGGANWFLARTWQSIRIVPLFDEGWDVEVLYVLGVGGSDGKLAGVDEEGEEGELAEIGGE